MTVSQIELAQARRAAAEKQRRSLIAQKARRSPEWSSSNEDIRKFCIALAVVVIAGVIAGVIGVGIFRHAFERSSDAATIREIRAECDAQGLGLHVDRGADGRLLAARCEEGK